MKLAEYLYVEFLFIHYRSGFGCASESASLFSPQIARIKIYFHENNSASGKVNSNFEGSR